MEWDRSESKQQSACPLSGNMIRKLADLAIRQTAFAYAPYSGFTVGAALLACDGQIFTGCNVENAAYGPSNCAERTAVFKAVSEGVRNFRAIAIAGGKDGQITGECPPCGVCRQVLMEFCDPENFWIITVGPAHTGHIYTLGQLLPKGFGPANLEG